MIGRILFLTLHSIPPAATRACILGAGKRPLQLLGLRIKLTKCLVSFMLASIMAVISWEVLFLVLVVSAVYSAVSWNSHRAPGCKAPPTRRGWDPVLGIDLVREVMADVKEGRRVKAIISRLRNYNYTFQSYTFGQRTLFTMEPRNVQSILATDFESWGGKLLLNSLANGLHSIEPLVRPFGEQPAPLFQYNYAALTCCYLSG